MSGGSFNYLYCKEVPDVFNYVSDLEEMEQFLISDGHIDIAKDIRRLIEYIRSAENRIGVLFEALNKVIHDIEWYVSADIGKERLLKTLDDYRIGEMKTKTATNNIKMKLDNYVLYPPTRAHADDAGLDLKSPYDVIVAPRDSITIDTGVHIAIPKGYVGMLKSKSGLNVNHGITSEGVIDAGYTGSIVCPLYNRSDRPYVIHAGDKITQLVIMPIITPEIEYVDELEDTERGSDGFGSSGK